jgi:hypothetical protein
MQPPEKNQRRESVPTKPERQPPVIEVVFDTPSQAESPGSTASQTGSPSQNGSRRQKNRLIFRF